MTFLLAPPRWFWRAGAVLAAWMVCGGVLLLVGGQPVVGASNLVLGGLMYASAFYALRNGRPFGSKPENLQAAS